MKRFGKAAVAVAGAALVVVPATAAIAADSDRDGRGGWEGNGGRTVAEGLSGPRQLSDYRGDRLVVAESDSGEVSSVDLDSGRVRTLLDGLVNPQGVAYDDGLLYVALGAAPEEEPAEEPTDTVTPTEVTETTATGTTATQTTATETTATGTTATGTTATETSDTSSPTTTGTATTTATSTETSTSTSTSISTSPTEPTATETTATETTPTSPTETTSTSPTETTTTSPAEPCTTVPGETTGEDPVSSALVIAEPGGKILETIDLLAHELECNPDGQDQELPDGAPVEDALSNPFAVHVQDDRILVADAGANAVLSIDRHTGEIAPFFVPEPVSPDDVPACADAQINPGVTGCDPVPTGIAEGPDGKLYVSTLGAEVPGAARVHVLDQRGEQVDVIEHLTSATGVAVDRHGRVYVSNLSANAPEEEELPSPADFDYSTVGEIVRIDPDGDRSAAQVTMPTGLHIEDGKLYSSAWSVAGFVPGLAESLGHSPDEGLGQVVKVGRGEFTPVVEDPVAPTPTETSVPTETAGPTETVDPTETTVPTETTETTVPTETAVTSAGG